MTGEVDARIAQWRDTLARSAALTAADADELEEHLRESMADLERAGLDADEAFLIAVKRLGATDAVTAEFAREHGDRLWKQLVPPTPAGPQRGQFWRMAAVAVLGAVAIQIARLIAQQDPATEFWLVRNLAFFVLVPLAVYFVLARRVPPRVGIPLGLGVALLAVAVNLFPDPGTATGAQTPLLVASHLFLVLWFAVLTAYTSGRRPSAPRRMDAVRFTGEWAIYLALIALGGGVLMVLTITVLAPVAPRAIDEVAAWVLPSGVVGATVVAAWLVESKKSIVENLAPVLTAIFTPLFAVGLVAAAVVYLVAGIGVAFDRELLVGFDVLLLVVVALVLYGSSARDPLRPTGIMDLARLVAIVAAVLLDALVLISMLGRIGEFGFTPNRVAALGFNLLLIVDLIVTAVLGLLNSPTRYRRMAAWQTGFLPAFGLWAVVVVLVLPPLFGFA